MGKLSSDSGAGRPGPQGTTLFSPGEIDEVLASPSADDKGDVDRAALLGIKPPFLDQRFVLRRGKTLVGRHSENDIVLPDPSVSSRHAWILHDEGRYRLMNMLSTNGTYLNDVKVHEGPIAEGDRIRFGRAEFVFREGARAAEPPEAGKVPVWVWVGAAALLALAIATLVLL